MIFQASYNVRKSRDSLQYIKWLWVSEERFWPSDRNHRKEYGGKNKKKQEILYEVVNGFMGICGHEVGDAFCDNRPDVTWITATTVVCRRAVDNGDEITLSWYSNCDFSMRTGEKLMVTNNSQWPRLRNLFYWVLWASPWPRTVRTTHIRLIKSEDCP